MNRALQIINFGKREFSDFYKLNNRLWLQRLANDITDAVVFVEHPHVIIVGNKGNTQDIKFPYAMARREEIPLCQVDWAGDITYRGPGQLIVYPVIHLSRHGLTLEEIKHKMEDVLIHLLYQYGVKAHVLPDGNGIGVDGCKIACMEVEVRQKVTRFSLALNVNPRLSLLRMLQLDAGETKGVTSLYYLLKKKIDVEVLKMHFMHHFQREFGFTVEDASSF